MNWPEIVEKVRTDHNGVMSVELFFGHDGHNVCRFKSYDELLGEGDSGRSIQEAVERCYEDWQLESGARWFAKNPEVATGDAPTEKKL